MKTLKRDGRRSDPATFEIVTSSQPELRLDRPANTSYIVDCSPDAILPSMMEQGSNLAVMDSLPSVIPGFDGVIGFNAERMFSEPMVGPELIYDQLLAEESARARGLVLVTATMLSALKDRPSGIPSHLLDAKRHFAMGTIVQSQGYFSDRWVSFMQEITFGPDRGMRFAANRFGILDCGDWKYGVLYFPREYIHEFQDPLEVEDVRGGLMEVV